MNNRVENQSQLRFNTNIEKRLRAGIEFNKILENIQVQKELKLSAHAMDRLRERNISLTDKDMANLNTAVENLRSKGGKEALIIYNNVAFITSIKNNTIITAVDSNNLKDNIFTNIDSAVII